MLILACDTSGPSVSVALWREQALIAEETLNIGLIHSVTFMPLVDELLRRTGLTAEDISLYAVTTGPGSFTGIRIGISAVQAMAYATGKPVVGFTSLDVMAWPYKTCVKTLVCPLIDARNQRVYAAAVLEGSLLCQPANQPLSVFCSTIRQLVRDRSDLERVLFVGFRPDGNHLAGLSQTTVLVQAPASMGLPRAASLAEMAEQAGSCGLVLQPGELKATYLAVSSAERLRDHEHAE